MFGLLEFIYNNFVLLGIVFASIALSLVLFKTVLLEFIFNKRLNTTKKSLRSYSDKGDKEPKLRSMYKVLLPLLIPIVFILGVVRNPITYDEHKNTIVSRSDFISVQETFQSKFFQTSSAHKLSQEEHFAIMDEQYAASPTLNESIDYVVHSNNHIFTLNNHGIEVSQILENDPDEAPKIDSIESLPLFDQDDIEPLGITQHDDLIYLIGHNSYDSASDIQSHEAKVKINVYDTTTFEQTDTFEFSGTPQQLSVEDGVLRIASQQYLPYDIEEFDVNDYLPVIRHNDDSIQQLFTAMRHIEGTNPNNLFTLFTLDFSTHDYEMDTTLLSESLQVEIYGDEVFILNESYEFHQASEYLELENPVASLRTSLTKLIIDGTTVDYYRTRMLEGTAENDALVLGTGFRMVLTRDDDNHLVLNRFNNQLDRLAQKTTDVDASIENSHFHRQRLYFLLPNEAVEIFDTDRPTVITKVYSHDIDRIPQTLFYTSPEVRLDYEFDDDRLVFTPFMWGDNLLKANEEGSAISHPTLRHSTVSEQFSSKDIAHIKEGNYFLVPTVSALNDEPQYQTRIGKLAFEEDSHNLHFDDAFHLPEVIYGISPFIYRTIVMDNYIYHLTPNGIAISSVESPSEMIEYETFE